MRHLATAMRAATADPPPTTISIDGLVTGEVRRRRRVRLLAVAGAVMVVAGSTPVMLGSGQAGPGWSPAEPAWSPAAPAPPTAGPSPTAPTRRDRQTDQRDGFTANAAAVVERWLPDGYRMVGSPLEYWAAEFSLMWADIAGPAGGRTQLYAYRVVGGPGPTREVCAQPPLDGTRFAGRQQDCEPLVVNREVFRIATSRDVVPGTEDEFEFTIVTRYGEGWTLHLWELPYAHPFSNLESRLLDAQVFTARQLAELARDPALNP